MIAEVERLERARELLSVGRPAECLSALPARGPLPGLLRPERDFLAAEALREQGFFQTAERLYAELLTGLDHRNDPVLWVEACLGSAQALRSVGRASAARRRLREARRVGRAFGLRAYESRLRLEAALADRAGGRYASSIKELNALLKPSLKRHLWAEAAFILWAMGGARRFKGELGAAEEDFLRSLKLARRAGDKAGQGYALFGLGGVARLQGRLKDSERYYARAGRIFASSQDLFARAYAACGLANALRQQGRLDRASFLYKDSRRLYARLEDEPDLAYVEWGLGRVHLQKGELPQALPCLRRALGLFQKHKETRGMVLAELSLAQALHALGRTQWAETLFARALLRSRCAGLHAHLEVFT